jgi:hypothetical protein
MWSTSGNIIVRLVLVGIFLWGLSGFSSNNRQIRDLARFPVIFAMWAFFKTFDQDSSNDSFSFPTAAATPVRVAPPPDPKEVAFQDIVRGIESRDPDIREQAVREFLGHEFSAKRKVNALERMLRRIVSENQTPHGDFLMDFVTAILGKLGKDAAPTLAKIVYGAEVFDPVLRQALLEVGPDAVPFLITELARDAELPNPHAPARTPSSGPNPQRNKLIIECIREAGWKNHPAVLAARNHRNPHIFHWVNTLFDDEKRS